jgi:septal ring-binding cell division protein DamX
MLEGEISQINLIARLVELWREQFTGALRFENDGIIKIIYFKGGDVLSASTNDRSDSIDEILTRAGKVSREHVKQALARRKESETLGDAMLNLGYITRKELTWARRVQVVGVIRSIAAWETGSFTIVADYLPKRDEGTLFPLPQLLVELIVTEQDRQKFERELGGGVAVFAKAGDFNEVFGRLGLNEDAEAIVAQVDGTRTASEVASASGKDAFNVYKLLHALATLGILEKAQVTPEFSMTEGSVADASDAWGDLNMTEPAFQLDEAVAAAQPTLELENLSFDADETAALASPLVTPSPSRSAWDEEEEDAVHPPLEPAPATRTPAWDAPPPVPPAAAIPIPAEPSVDARREQWGFDEAQIETAQRASAPAPIPPPAPSRKRSANEPLRPVVKSGGGRRTGLLLAFLVILIAGAAGYAGWMWWQKRQSAAEPQVAQGRPVTPPVVQGDAPAVPAETDTMGTIVEAPASATSPDPAATTSAPASQPLTVTSTAAATTSAAPAAPPATATTPPAVQPLPVVTPKNGGNSTLDEMARNFAANPQGNFTVQIQILCNPANVEQAMRQGGGSVWFVPQTIKGRSCYRVFWGRFASREEASRAMASVPAALRDPSAAVKAVPR